MEIRRSPSETSVFEDDVTDDHILDAITDPERVVLYQEDEYLRIVGVARPLPRPRLAIASPTANFPSPSLIRVAYVQEGDIALVLHAAEADEEDLEEWWTRNA